MLIRALFLAAAILCGMSTSSGAQAVPLAIVCNSIDDLRGIFIASQKWGASASSRRLMESSRKDQQGRAHCQVQLLFPPPDVKVVEVYDESEAGDALYTVVIVKIKSGGKIFYAALQYHLHYRKAEFPAGNRGEFFIATV